jgi:hypothetical protein
MSKEDSNICIQHSGCVADIRTLQESQKTQWDAIESIKNKVNMILGGVCVSCILLVINILITKVG